LFFATYPAQKKKPYNLIQLKFSNKIYLYFKEIREGGEMKKITVVVCTILSFNLLIHAVLDSEKNDERYLLTGNASVRIAVETGWQRHGLTPVRIDIHGLCLDLFMDGEGRVFDEDLMEAGMVEKIRSIRPGLFSLDKSKGLLQANDQTLSGQIYEQNALRTRLRLDKLALALRLDIPKGRAALEMNGIIIPVRMSLGKKDGGLQEISIGKMNQRGEGRLFLDAVQGRLFFENNHARPAAGKQQNRRVCWAEKQK